MKSSSETNEASVRHGPLSGVKTVPPSVSLVVGNVTEELSSAEVSDVGPWVHVPKLHCSDLAELIDSNQILLMLMFLLRLTC